MYVGKEGSNWNSGHTEQAPLATIQSALDRAVPGDTIIIMPGTYREWLRVRRGGKQGKELVIRALQPGTVLITGEAEAGVVADLQWRDEGSGIYSVIPPWPIYRVKSDGQTLYQPNTLKTLRNVVSRKSAFATSCYEAGRLYVWFPDRKSPALHDLQIHAKVPPPGLWRIWKSANVWVEAGHVRFEGLRFDFGIGSNLHLWNSAHVTVTNCLFSGAEIGVHGMAGIKSPDNLRIEQSAFHNYPQGNWLQSWLSWKEVYAFNSRSSLVRVKGDGIVVTGNLVVHGGDGMGVTTDDVPIEKGIEVKNNIIARCTDDAVEFDGFAKKIYFHDNLIYDCFVSLGVSPVLAGKVTIEHNDFLHPLNGLNGTQLKFSNPLNNGKIRNVVISQNNFVGRSLFWGKASVEHIKIIDNMIAVQENKRPLPDGVIESGNIYRDRSAIREQDFIRNYFSKIAMRPGPDWLDWHSLPATAELLEIFP